MRGLLGTVRLLATLAHTDVGGQGAFRTSMCKMSVCHSLCLQVNRE